MAIIKWEPTFGLQKASRRMRRMFDDFDTFFTDFSPALGHRSFTPMVDINEDKDNLYFIIELPGLSKEDVKLTVSEGVLTIRGEKKHVEEHNDRNVYRMERSYGEFVRQFALPEDVQEDDIQADFTNGVLEIMVPKKEPSNPKEHEVKIGQGAKTNGHAIGNGQLKREKAIA